MTNRASDISPLRNTDHALAVKADRVACDANHRVARADQNFAARARRNRHQIVDEHINDSCAFSARTAHRHAGKQLALGAVHGKPA